jgi:hypothetical protein
MTRVLTGLGWAFASLFWAVLVLGNLVLLENTALAQGANPCANTTVGTNNWCKCNCINAQGGLNIVLPDSSIINCRKVTTNVKGVTNMQNLTACCAEACDLVYPTPGSGGTEVSRCVTDVSQGVPAGCAAAQPTPLSPCYKTSTTNGTNCVTRQLVDLPASGTTTSICVCE